VIGALEIVAYVAATAVAVYGLVTTLRNRPPDRTHRFAVGAFEAILVVQAVIAVVRVFGGVTLPEQTTFLIYLLVSVCVMPIALQFATAEPTKWGGAVIAVGAIGTGVAVWRLHDLWVAGV
jgi:ABC-type xylose transport system permease subunit